jgi:hypothetical protein
MPFDRISFRCDGAQAFDASLLQYKTMLQTSISRVQIRQVYQWLSAATVVPTQLYQPFE